MISNVNTYIQSQNLDNGPFSRIFSANFKVIQKFVKWLIELTNVEDFDVFQTCCTFWLITSQMYQHEQQQKTRTIFTEIYASFIPEIRLILIKKMQNPDDYILYEDESGIIKIENLRNSYNIMMYSILKECLYNLTLIDPDGTIN